MPAKHTVYFEFKVRGDPTAEQKKVFVDWFHSRLGKKLKVLYHANNTFSVRGPTDDDEALTKADCQVVLDNILDHHKILEDLPFSGVENFKTTSSAKLRGKGGRRTRQSRRHRSRRGTMRR
jgi:hypothetical protein